MINNDKDKYKVFFFLFCFYKYVSNTFVYTE